MNNINRGGVYTLEKINNNKGKMNNNKGKMNNFICINKIIHIIHNGEFTHS